MLSTLLARSWLLTHLVPTAGQRDVSWYVVKGDGPANGPSNLDWVKANVSGAWRPLGPHLCLAPVRVQCLPLRERAEAESAGRAAPGRDECDPLLRLLVGRRRERPAGPAAGPALHQPVLRTAPLLTFRGHRRSGAPVRRARAALHPRPMLEAREQRGRRRLCGANGAVRYREQLQRRPLRF